MEKVVAVNLNGNSYQFDESAYDALLAYLDRAEAALKDNPDKAEILRDLEQAIAEKANAYLSAHKTVVSAAEIEAILREMGPVEGAPADAEAEHAAATDGESARPKKRLYRVRDGAMIAGVCSGLGAYFDIDANIVRILFVIAAFLTSGAALLVYVVMMFVIPSAHTSEEWAAAHGLPFNAQEVIDRAKREYARFAHEGPNWRWMRKARREWRGAMRQHRRWGTYAWDYPPPTANPPRGPASYLMRVLAGLFVVVFSLIGAALTIAFLVALISLATSGAVLGWAPPASVPIWMAIIVLAIVYAALSAPFAALRHASHAALTGAPYYRERGAGLVTLLIFLLIGWLAYTHIPAAHVWIDQVAHYWSVWIEDVFPALQTTSAT